MAPHIERITAEADELADRLSKLGAFLIGEKFALLPETDKSLMNAQVGAMTAYMSVLNLRIQRAASV